MSQSEAFTEESFVTLDEVGADSENENESVILIEPNVSTITVVDNSIEIRDYESDGEIHSDPENRPISTEVENGLHSDPDTNLQNTENNGNSETTEDLNTTPVNNMEPPETEVKQLIKINFADKKTYLMFHEEFIEIINRRYKKNIDDLEIDDNIREKHICVSEKVVKKCDKFLIDTTPNSKSGNKTPTEVTPTYKTTFQNIILSGEKNTERGFTNASRPKNICFNCEKDTHTLRDCPEKRNSRKIQKAREEYCKKNDRYHEEFENKYGHMEPGIISEKLRGALGLRRNELPLYIYKMRVLGYPPGWLEEAKIQHSGLSLFDSKGKKVLEDDEDEGEIDNPRFKYDIQKIHDFPGFNTDPGPVNEANWARDFPPMDIFDSKEEFIRFLTENGCIVDGYKRRKLSNLPAADDELNNQDMPNDVTTLTTTEMEIDEVIDEVPVGVTIVDIQSSPEPEDTEEKSFVDNENCVNLLDDENFPGSPSLEELEKNRRRLMSALANSSAYSDVTLDSNIEGCSSSLLETINSTDTIEIADDSNSCTIVENSNNNTINETILENSVNENTENTKIERHPEVEELPPLPASDETLQPPPPPKFVQSTMMGAPILPSFSGHRTLPCGEKFSQGVCPVINFENLPDSTGKYEQMRSLLQKVRTKITKIQQE